tara:strand:+ start:2010 stop:2822 length:813 start_codon:yes stop_codon:yes gene_type:complete
MKILVKNEDINEALKSVSNLGFVPTMGSLHKGHEYLINQSKKKCKKTLVSIFVNPRQFNNKKDYLSYPKNLKRDIILLKKLKVDFLYVPKKEDIYFYKRKKKIILKNENKILCAKFRKGHFEGVIDVMDRLTNIIRPRKIFMGEKDYQQMLLVKKFIEKKYKTKIISCKTIRNNDHLALSSRNELLNKTDMIMAGKIAKELLHFKKSLKNSKNIKSLLQSKFDFLKKKFDIRIEYLEIRKKNNLKISNNIKNSKIFIAYFINKVRLIDNF